MLINIFFIECLFVIQAVLSEPTNTTGDFKNNTGDFENIQQTNNAELSISSMQAK